MKVKFYDADTEKLIESRVVEDKELSLKLDQAVIVSDGKTHLMGFVKYLKKSKVGNIKVKISSLTTCYMFQDL